MSFEKIVQPFQSLDVSYPRRIIKADAGAEPENVVLSVGGGGGGSVKTLGYSRSVSITTYMVKVQKEVKKKEEPPPANENTDIVQPSTNPANPAPAGGLK